MTTGQEGWPVVLVASVSEDLAVVTSMAEGMGIVIKRSKKLLCECTALLSGRAAIRIGWIIWRKDLRRWDVLIRTDASTAQAAALIQEAIATQMEFGTCPGHGLRGRPWQHRVGDLYGRHAFCDVVTVIDRESAFEDLVVEVPDDLSGHMGLLLAAFSNEVKS